MNKNDKVTLTKVNKSGSDLFTKFASIDTTSENVRFKIKVDSSSAFQYVSDVGILIKKNS